MALWFYEKLDKSLSRHCTESCWQERSVHLVINIIHMLFSSLHPISSQPVNVPHS